MALGESALLSEGWLDEADVFGADLEQAVSNAMAKAVAVIFMQVMVDPLWFRREW